MSEEGTNNPSGLEKNDTLEDALKRADELSRPDGSAYSGMMLDRKDLRRIVLLAREYRKILDIDPWISTEERLPSLNQDVLCYQPLRHGITGQAFEPRILQGYLFELKRGERDGYINQKNIGDDLHSIWSGGKFFAFPYICHQNFVTHWKPLPGFPTPR